MSARYVVRLGGAIVLAVAAVLVFFIAKPDVSKFKADQSAALADDSLNNARAEGAPQQAVVNGWTTRDLLTVIAAENRQRDPRIPAELVLAVLGLALIAATSEGPTKQPVLPRNPLPADFDSVTVGG